MCLKNFKKFLEFINYEFKKLIIIHIKFINMELIHCKFGYYRSEANNRSVSNYLNILVIFNDINLIFLIYLDKCLLIITENFFLKKDKS